MIPPEDIHLLLKRLGDDWPSDASVVERVMQQIGEAGGAGGGLNEAGQQTEVGRSPFPPTALDAGSTPICIVVGSLSRPASSPLWGFFAQVGPFSYLVSAIIMCVAFLGAWQYKIADRVQRGETVQTRPSATAVPHSDVAAVGRITGMDGCEWADGLPIETNRQAWHRSASIASPVPLGRKIDLDSGLLEITFTSGAQVILQGPASFEVESNGGLLSVGRLTGTFEKSSETNPQSPIANPPFVIRTPTATITDLGTEFGVEVDKYGRTASYVFRGAVKVHAVASTERQEDLILKESEGARVESLGNPVPAIYRTEIDSRRFARHVNKNRRIPIEVFGTGIGVKAAEPDPHWQLLAATNEPNLRPRAATVVRSLGPNWVAGSPGAARWIAGCPEWYVLFPPGGGYTFRTTFELGDDALLETATLFGRVFFDAKIHAIRLNDQDIPASEPRWQPKYEWEKAESVRAIAIARGFVVGRNVLDIAVEAGKTPFAGAAMSSLGIRVELEGSVQQKP